MTRETLLAHTLVELADTLVDDFDVVDLLTTLVDRCGQVLDIAAAGIMLVAPNGELRLMTSTSEAMRLVEVFELQSQEGPCLDCYRSGQPVLHAALAATGARWPLFTPVAIDAGFRGVEAIPMRLRRNVIGALNLFHADETSLNDADIVAAKALADVATIAILQHAAAASAHLVNAQLNQALNSRIIVEQAKGVIAERQRFSMDEAFKALRNHSRNHNLRLADVAEAVVDGSLGPDSLDPVRTRSRRAGT
ncbi:MAG: GAF and ANTAR domain-containing protein [Ilumatobacteraceae bacterium]